MLHDRIEQLTNRHVAKLMKELENECAYELKKPIKLEFWRLKDDIVLSFNQYIKGEGLETWEGN